MSEREILSFDAVMHNIINAHNILYEVAELK
jgi:hypothetical protein